MKIISIIIFVRMRETKILLIGFKAIHSEVCKNLVLAGIYSITVYLI